MIEFYARGARNVSHSLGVARNRDPSNVTDDTEARHTAHTAAGSRHEEAVLPTRILVGKVAVTTFVTHKHPFLANFTYTPKC